MCEAKGPVLGEKRIRDDDKPALGQGFQSPFIISQDEEEDEMEDLEDLDFLPQKKKPRLGGAFCFHGTFIPPVATTPPPSIESCHTGSDENLPPTDWWRQRPRPIATAPQCCFVCQKPADQPRRPARSPMKTNTLLNYSFTAATARSQSQQEVSSSSLNFQSCSFCDRPACCSCTRQCERCQADFCTLCSTLDYSSSTERCFCLDCMAATSAADSQMTD